MHIQLYEGSLSELTLRPDADRLRPAADHLRPFADHLRPDAENLCPSADCLHSAADHLRPDADNSRPATDPSRPALLFECSIAPCILIMTWLYLYIFRCGTGHTAPGESQENLCIITQRPYLSWERAGEWTHNMLTLITQG